MVFEVGTPGVGPGTFATIGYEKVVPEKAYVRVEAEFPSATSGGASIKQSFDLKLRC